MGYFLPSFFQKRVLRYALSRLDFLDTDTLDLDNLDIVWGRRSTIELRDVALNTEVLLLYLLCAAIISIITLTSTEDH